MLTTGKWVRIECDVEVTDRSHDNNFIDLTTAMEEKTFLDLFREAMSAGWEKIGGKWHCPECAAKHKSVK